MPLVRGKSKAAVSQNIKTEMAAGKPQKQAVAIALDVARRAKRDRADGGGVFEGPIISTVPGRTDHHPIDVPSGAYVIPSETVSSLGENNTNAGLKRLQDMGPHGFKKLVGGSVRHFAKRTTKAKSTGGKVDRGGTAGQPVPINAAGGEFVVPPAWVSHVGDGDLKRGHAIIDHWVMENRKKHIATLRSLPGPAQD